MKQVFRGIFRKGDFLYTKNLVPGKVVYGERLVNEAGIEYREWNHRRSKLAAAIIKGISQVPLKESDVVLYLGAASGTTVSHVSDIASFVFALDFAPRVVRDLVFLCEQRKNIAPLLADANNPESYADRISAVDIVYQDIAQRSQVGIFIKNCDSFLRKGGFGMLALKARSVDVTKKPREVFRQARAELEKRMTLTDYRELYPFEKDHCFYICKKK